MLGYLDRVWPGSVIGWAYDERRPTSRVRITVKVGGRVIGTGTADQYREDLARAERADGHCAFFLEIERLDDVLSALTEGRLTVEAEGSINGLDGSVETFELPHSDYILPYQTLGSSRDFFGNVNVSQFLYYIRQLANRPERNRNNSQYCLSLLNYARVYFPQDARGAGFCELGVELANAAKAPHTARFYQACLDGMNTASAQADAPDFNLSGFSGVVPTYATPQDLIDITDGRHIILDVAQRIDGGRDPCYLTLCGLFGHDHDSEQPPIRALAFRVNGYGGTGWSVTKGDGQFEVFEQIYLVDFEQLRCAVDEGRIVLLDMSAEGPAPYPHWTEVVNAAMKDLGLPAAQVLFVNQNLAFAVGAKETKLRANIAHAHYNAHHGLNLLANTYRSDEILAGYVSSLLKARRARSDIRKYVCLNFTPRWSRWATVLSLSYNGHLSEGYVSFPGVANQKLQPDGPEAYRMPPIRNREAYLAHLPEFLQLCPLVVDVDAQSDPVPDYVFPTGVFTDSLIHILTETEMAAGNVRRVTEKILKPIVALQPFLLFGNPGSLDILRKLGFRTFSGLFDESYDEVVGVAERFDAVEAEMLRCLSLDVPTLRTAVESVEDAVLHNFIHLVRVVPTLFNKGIENRLRSAMVRMDARIREPGGTT